MVHTVNPPRLILFAEGGSIFQSASIHLIPISRSQSDFAPQREIQQVLMSNMTVSKAAPKVQATTETNNVMSGARVR